ncbi:SDR family NAD(P)-dependent oxidoreductase [Micromonospora sp. NPDC005087]|uniref:SDR family NAD(P)-dependent oxidoreductase n=1 Tax=Micromonospora sp. NPDC005087 TaxID=3364225 RepID=UPI003696C45A
MTGRTALITGATGDIGGAIARAMSAAGYALTVTGRRAEVLGRTVATLPAGADADTVVADLRDDDARTGLVTRHASRYGRMDALVVCAGAGWSRPLADSRAQHFDDAFAVNARASFALVADSIGLLRKAAEETGAARVVVVSSLTAHYPEAGLAAYSASKAALGSLCRSVNIEHAADGILASAICPGYVDTRMSDWKKDVIAADRMVTTADVTAAVMFVLGLSPAAVVPEIQLIRASSRLYEA